MPAHNALHRRASPRTRTHTHTHTSSIVRLIRCDREQCVTECRLPHAMLFFEGMLSLDVTSRGWMSVDWRDAGKGETTADG